VFSVKSTHIGYLVTAAHWRNQLWKLRTVKVRQEIYNFALATQGLCLLKLNCINLSTHLCSYFKSLMKPQISSDIQQLFGINERLGRITSSYVVRNPANTSDSASLSIFNWAFCNEYNVVCLIIYSYYHWCEECPLQAISNLYVFLQGSKIMTTCMTLLTQLHPQ